MNSRGRQVDCGQANWLQEQSAIGREASPEEGEGGRFVSELYGYNRNGNRSSSNSSSGSSLREGKRAIKLAGADGTRRRRLREEEEEEICDSPAAYFTGTDIGDDDVSLSQANWLDCLCGSSKGQANEEPRRIKDKNGELEASESSKYE